ncbi:MAG: hypothetical protein AAB515_03105 [Patescibacteria group bacterium]
MKIAILGSMQFSLGMQDVGKRLVDLGHTPIYSTFLSTMLGKTAEEQEILKLQQKHAEDAIRKDIENFADADGVLVLNFDKNGVENYIGGNTFLEIGIAYLQRKKIFFWKPIPQNPFYESEIQAMKPLVLNGDLGQIQNL